MIMHNNKHTNPNNGAPFCNNEFKIINVNDNTNNTEHINHTSDNHINNMMNNMNKCAMIY